MNIFHILAQQRQNFESSRRLTREITGQKIQSFHTNHFIENSSIPKKNAKGNHHEQYIIETNLSDIDLKEHHGYSPIKLKSLKKLLISENSKPKKIFNALMNILISYSDFSSLYFLAFQDLNALESIIENCIWSLFFLDFLLNFITEFRDKNHEIVKNPKEIRIVCFFI